MPCVSPMLPGADALRPFLDATQELVALQVRWFEQLADLQAIWLAPWIAMQSHWMRGFAQPQAFAGIEWPDPTAAALYWQRGAEQLA